MIQLYYSGSHLIYEVDYSAFYMVAVSRNIKLSTTVFHRDRYSDHSSSSSAQLNSAPWSLLMICIHTNTLMIYRHMAGDHQRSTRPAVELRSRCLWMQSHRLQLNSSKMEFIWCCSSRRRQHIPDGHFHVSVGCGWGVNKLVPASAGGLKILSCTCGASN